MKIKEYDITPSNVWAYIQGTGRKKLEDINIELFKSPKHIQEMIIWRHEICNLDCLNQKKCVECKCKMPDKLYSDKECEGGCYPKMFNEEEWDNVKKYCINNKINLFQRDFDWEYLLDRIKFNKSKESSPSSIISIEDSNKDLGVVKSGEIVRTSIQINNPYKEDLVINTIIPNCSCTKTILNNNVIESNNSEVLLVEINTRGLTFGSRDIWLTIRYNGIKKISVKLNYKIIK